MKTGKPPIRYHRTNCCVQCFCLVSNGCREASEHWTPHGPYYRPVLCPMLQRYRLAPWMMLSTKKDFLVCVQCSRSKLTRRIYP